MGAPIERFPRTMTEVSSVSPLASRSGVRQRNLLAARRLCLACWLPEQEEVQQVVMAIVWAEGIHSRNAHLRIHDLALPILGNLAGQGDGLLGAYIDRGSADTESKSAGLGHKAHAGIVKGQA